MGILSALTAIVNGPYRYRAGPNTLGIGTENLALEQPGRAIDQDFNSARYNIRKEFKTQFPTFPNMGQALPSVDLRASGVYLSGDLELAALIQSYNERQNP